jgi:DNA-binding response OmpR family regulator
VAVSEAQAALTERSDKPLVLVIDDDLNVHHLLEQNLGEAGYQVVSAYRGDEGVQKAQEAEPFAIILDIRMPDIDGWQVMQDLKLHLEPVPSR